MTKSTRAALVFAIALSTLAGCQSSEERAEEHFKTALEHLESGDLQRARIEFQNVFKLNGNHRDARAAYANSQIENGDLTEAYSQYLRLVEQYPDDIEGRDALARLALDSGNWDELKRHGEHLAALAPESVTAQVSTVALTYRDAILSGDTDTQRSAKAKALELLAQHSNRRGLRRIVIDDYLRLRDWGSALQQVDIDLKNTPESLEMNRAKLSILYKMNDAAQIEAHLLRMTEQFPENQQIAAALIQWHISRHEIDKAETQLRARVDPSDESVDSGAALIRFLTEFRGNDAARAELDGLIGNDLPHQAFYRSLRASLNFDDGLRDQAIAEMQAIVDTSEPSDATDNAKVALAHMLEATGNPVGARALVEEVLERDATHIPALKRRAGWLIDDDQTGDAMVTLREALANDPRDPEIMTLMARAHERDGNKELMAEMLALAVEHSGEAPAESLRYAQLLVSQKKYIPAEGILLSVIRKQPENIAVLSALGNLYVSMRDWGRSDDVVRSLQSIGSEQANAVANDLTARLLTAQNRRDELNTFLSNLTKGTDEVTQADIAIIRQHVQQNDLTSALSYVDKLLTIQPDAPLLHFLRASVLAQSDRIPEAEAIFNQLLLNNKQSPELWIALYRLQRSSGRAELAAETLSQAQVALPESTQLKWIVAGELEGAGDVDGAIAIYEDLYAADSSNQVVANNLASLLADHRADTQSLERAYTIARRLRGSEFAPFQDTYGWIAYRLENHEEAVTYLEPAAAGMPDNSAVQFHLAMAYAALNRNAEALAQFEKTKAMLKSSSQPDFAQTIDDEIVRLKADAAGKTEN